MPRFEWREDDMKTSLDFFPLVGAVIGTLICLLNIGPMAQINPYVRAILSVLIPVLVTGGFHLDGFMDTSDALNSYGEFEKKLEILKDPHIGAFSVISLVKLILISTAASIFIITSENLTEGMVIICALIFVVSRCISGLTSLFLKKAKKSGMLSKEAGDVKKFTIVLLVVQLLISATAMIILDPVTAIPVLAFFAGCTLYYKYKTKKEFGGVTGDTAGFFVCISETGAVCTIAIILYLMRII